MAPPFDLARAHRSPGVKRSSPSRPRRSNARPSQSTTSVAAGVAVSSIWLPQPSSSATASGRSPTSSSPSRPCRSTRAAASGTARVHRAATSIRPTAKAPASTLARSSDGLISGACHWFATTSNRAPMPTPRATRAGQGRATGDRAWFRRQTRATSALIRWPQLPARPGGPPVCGVLFCW